jgi:hypothetical protein
VLHSSKGRDDIIMSVATVLPSSDGNDDVMMHVYCGPPIKAPVALSLNHNRRIFTWTPSDCQNFPTPSSTSSPSRPPPLLLGPRYCLLDHPIVTTSTGSTPSTPHSPDRHRCTGVQRSLCHRHHGPKSYSPLLLHRRVHTGASLTTSTATWSTPPPT